MMTRAILTIDQRRSRSGPDLVPALLETLNSPDLGAPLRPFERTAGDEVQGVLDEGSALVRRLEVLLRSGAWNIGLGLGPVEEPLPVSTRAGRGEAFVLARQAVTRAKQLPNRLCVLGTSSVGAGRYGADRIETIAWLWAGVLARRSTRGWEVADLLSTGISHAEAAHRLGISQSAVSQRAQTAGLLEAARAATLLTELFDEVLAGRPPAEGEG